MTPTSADRLALAAAGIDPDPVAGALRGAAAGAATQAAGPGAGARREPGRLPSAGETRRAAARVDAMSLPELAGQVIVANYEGTSAPVALVRPLHLGGVIVFTENVTSTGQIRRSTRPSPGRYDARCWSASTRRVAPWRG